MSKPQHTHFADAATITHIYNIENELQALKLNRSKLLSWIKDGTKPANIAFTESEERQIAYMIETYWERK